MTPAVGTEQDGYRFIGGDPASQSSWEPVSLRIGTVDAGYRFLGGDPSQESNWSLDDGKQTTQGDFMRGAKESFQQLPMIGHGLVAGVGAAGESAFGEGGIFTGMKKSGIKGYTEWGDKIAANAKESDSFDYSYDKAKEGDFGALVDWLQHGLGYVGGQAIQTLATGGIGAVGGKFVAGTAAKQIAKGMVAKESARLAAESAGKATAEQIAKQATANVAAKFSLIGQTAALGANATGMEGGEIFGDLTKSNPDRALTGSELAKAFGTTLAAGGLEFVGDKLGLDIMLGRSELLKPAASMTGIGGRATRGIIAGAGAMPIEAGTEYGQTLLEEYGKGNDPFSADSLKQARESAALGALGGAAIGGIGGAVRGAKEQEQPPGPAPAPTLQIGNTSDPMVGFPDGTVGRRADVDRYINSLPEDQRVSARSKLYGFGPEQAINAIGAAASVDEAIAAANAAVSAPTTLTGQDRATLMTPPENIMGAVYERQAQTAADQADLDAFVQSETRDLNTLRAQTIENMRKQREMDQIQSAGTGQYGVRPEQRAAVADAATVDAPTAMQLAMQRATRKSDPTAQTESPPTAAQLPSASAVGAAQQTQTLAPGSDALRPPTLAKGQDAGSGQTVLASQNDTIQPDILPTDIARLDGKPFQTANGARLKQREAGGIEGSDIVAVAGGFVVRPKVSQPQEIASVPTSDQAEQSQAQRQTPERSTIDAGAAPRDAAPALESATDSAAVQAVDAESDAGSLSADQRLVPASKRISEGDTTKPVAATRQTESERQERQSPSPSAADAAPQKSAEIPATSVPQSPTGEQDQSERKGQTVQSSPDVTPATTPGKVVSTFTGKYGKGMGRDAARLEASRRNRSGDGITYTAEEHGDDSLEHPYAVVGRKVEAVAKVLASEVTPPITSAPARTAIDETRDRIAREEGQSRTSRSTTIEKLVASGLRPKKVEVGKTRNTAAQGGGYKPKYEWRLVVDKDNYIPLTEAEAKKINGASLVVAEPDARIAREAIVPANDKAVPANPVVLAQAEYDKAKAALDAIGEEPPQRSNEAKAFGSRGRAGADPKDVAKYDADVKAHAAWRRKYSALKKAEVERSNELFYAKKAVQGYVQSDVAPPAPENSDAPAEPEATPATQATAALDAANVTGKERLDVLKDVKAGTLTPEEVKAAYPAPVSSREGQMNLANRGSRIASLKLMNEQLRKIAPDEAWHDKNIEDAKDLDALQDQISEALVKANRGSQDASPLRTELEQLSGAELRTIFEKMNLAGTRMTATERVDALVAENEAEVRAAMASTNTENAGDELTYNKRNRVKSGIKWDDIADKDVALRVKETTKANVHPKPDYQAMVDGGMEPIVAHMVKQAYDSLSVAPNTGNYAPTDADLKRYIDGVHRYMDGVMAWANDKDQIRAWVARIGKRAGVLAGASSGQMTSLSEIAGQSEKSLIDVVYPDGWKNHRDELRSIGGNKALNGLQPSTDEAMKAVKDIEKGWPGKQEAWQRQGYKIVDGKDLKADFYTGKHGNGDPYTTAWLRSGRITIVQRSFDGATSKDDPIVQDWVKLETEAYAGRHVLLNKSNRVVGWGMTPEEAVELARSETKRDGKTTISDKGISVEAAEREGVQHRMDGEDISSDRLKEAFGLKGVNFGNWMLGKSHEKERQLHLNHAYDSFMDLAQALGVPPKALSLNGMLGLAIGAQGNGKAAAHFVPGVNEINLTRTSGAGSLAHEFGHGLDHYFARHADLGRNSDPFLTEYASRKLAGDIRPEIVEAFKTIVQAMNKRPTTQAETALRRQESIKKAKRNVDGWMASIRKDFERIAESDKKAPAGMLEQFDALAQRIKALDLGDGRVAVSGGFTMSQPVSDMRDLYKQATGRVYSLDQIKGLQSNVDHLKYLSDAIDSAAGHVPQQVMTDYAAAALRIDKEKGGKPYWSTNLEKFARAFDAFISDKLEAAAAKNTYLSHAGRTGETVPMGTERTAINAGIQQLIDTIQTKEDDVGNVAMFNTKDDDPFYSALSREIGAINAKAQAGPGWAMNIAGLVKAGKVKQDEVNWTGILDWLRLQEGKVTREQVSAYLNANGVQIEETVLGSGTSNVDAEIQTLRAAGLSVERNPERPEDVGFMDDQGDLMSATDVANFAGDAGWSPDVVRAARVVEDAESGRTDASKYGQYQLPGGTNYREVLLTLPEKPPATELPSGFEAIEKFNNGPNSRWVINGPGPLPENRYGSGATREEAILRFVQNGHTKDRGFKSPHWSQPNVLAHIRVNDRTDADGKKVLFVEEIQSDWGQSGKKNGFGVSPRFEVSGPNGVMGLYGSMAEAEAVRARNDRPQYIHIRQAGMVGVPIAPFVTKTDAWLSLALKRIVKMAADGGYDRVAFVNGEQSAERYDLSKQLSAVHLTSDRGGKRFGEDHLGPVREDIFPATLDADGMNGQRVMSKDVDNEEQLADFIGKEAARKLIDAERGTSRRGFPKRSLSGLDLKVGGEGMKAFYDRIVPNTLKDVLKKVGGGALETVQFQDTKDVDLKALGVSAAEWRGMSANTRALLLADSQKKMGQPGFTVTPAMREKASGGLPMFAQEAYTPNDGQQQSTADLTQAAQGNIDRLNRAITRFLDKPGTSARPFQARRLRDHAGLQGLGDAFGATIQGFRVDPSLRADVAREFDFFNGVYTSGTIYLNENSQRPHLAILGHELAHQLAKTNYVLYRQLVNAIEPFIDKAKYPAFARTAVGREHANNAEKLREEFVGEVLSDGFMNRDFWRAVGKKNPSLLQRIVRMVGELLNKALAKMGYSNRSEQYLTDFNRVMQVAGEVMGEYGLKPPAVAAGGGLSFGRGANAPVATNDDVAGKSLGGRSAGDNTSGVLFTDENENAIVFASGDFRISVNKPGGASFVVLWAKQEVNGKTYWRKAGTLNTNEKSKIINGVAGHYLGVSSVSIEKEYRGRGMGLQMYRALLSQAAPDIAGIISHTPSRVNKKQVPSIYRSLGAFSDGDNQIIPTRRNESTAPDSDLSFGRTGDKTGEKLTDLQALNRFWRHRDWADEAEAVGMIRRRLIEDNERYPMFKTLSPDLANQLEFTRAAGGRVKLKADRSLDAPNTPNPIGQGSPEGATPKVDWESIDNADDGTEASIMKAYGRGKGRLYQAWIDPSNLPKSRGEDINDGLLEDDDAIARGGNDVFPPIKIRIGPRGKIELMDGNHRLAYWRDRGYDMVPAYVIDERPEPDDGAVSFSKTGQTESAAFRKWFGDSKVVDADGKPMVVYHGTGAGGFTSFKENADHFFTNDVAVARSYIKDSDFASKGDFLPHGIRDKSDLTRLGYAFYKNAGKWHVSSGESATRGALGGVAFETEDQAVSRALEVANAVNQDQEFGGVYPVYLSIKRPMIVNAKGRLWNNVDDGESSIRDLFEHLDRSKFDGLIVKNVLDYGNSNSLDELSHTVYVVDRSTQIKSAIGNRGTFDPKNPDIRFNTKITGQITGQTIPQTWQAPDASKMDDFIYSIQDKHIDTKRVVKAVRDAIGGIADNLDPYLQEELYHGRAAMATKEFLEKSLRPLLTDMQARGIEMSDFEEYLHNRHAERRNVQVAKVNPAMQDGGSGIKTADARAYLAGLPATKRTAYQALARRIDQMNRETRALLVSSGLEKQSTIDAWEMAYGDEYVPLMREEMDNGAMGIGQGFSVRGSSSKRAMGSDKPVANILANMALQREKAITRAEKRKIGEALYGMVLSAPNPDFWFAIDPALAQNPSQITATAFQLISMGMSPADAEAIAAEPTQRYIDPRTKQVAYRINPALRSADNVLAVRIDGEDKYVFFNAQDERAMRMAKALKNLDSDQLGFVLGTTAKVTRYFSAVNTQWNPIFGVVNITRDIQTALLNLQSTPLHGKQVEVMKHVGSALKGIYIDLRDHRAGKTPSSSWAQLFEEFQREGGATGYRDMYANAKERADSIVSELKQIKSGTALNVGRGIMGWLSDYNEAMENAVRVASYKVGKEQGMSNQQAASLAKNLTVNFNRKGQTALQAGALYAFFNASIQGSARMAQTMFEGGKLSGIGKKILTGGLLLGSMQALLLAAAGFDDDEPPDFVRERSLVIPIGGDKYISIPMPLGFHVIPNLARIPTEWAMGGFKNTPKRIAQLVGLFADAFNPIGGAGLSLQTLTPTIIDPLAALAENKDWTGKPIARKDFSSLKPTAGHTRAKDTATPWAKAISYAVNMATGGTDYKPGMVSPTPDQIDYLIGQATGGVGREASKLSQVASSTLSGEELPLYKIPLVGRFVGTTAGQAAEASRFYENMREIGEHDSELTGLRKDHKMAERAQYIRDNREAMLVPIANKTYREVSKLNTQKRDLIKAGASRDRVKLIEQQITARMRAFNTRVEAMREPAT